MYKTNRIIFRADGNATNGLGHLTRSLALAKMAQPEFTGVFATQAPAPEFMATLEAAGLELISLPLTADYLTEANHLINQLQPGDIIVLDGYRFSTEYQQIIKSNHYQLICLDDIHAFPFLANAIINPAGGVDPNQYQAEPYTQYYLGPAYALLRQPFLIAASQSRSVHAIQNVLLNMGGADPNNETLRLLQTTLINQPTLYINVVVGAAYQYLNELKDFVQANKNVTVHQNLPAEAMCHLMQNCEAAILPPSSVAYEWCSVSGLLFIHQIAENQRDLGDFLIQEGLAFPVDQLNQILENKKVSAIIQQQIKHQRRYFDGQSQHRLKRIFSELNILNSLQLRLAQARDMEQLFIWANDPSVRKHSFNPAPIPFEIHQRWFTGKLNSLDCLIYIILIKAVPAGMIRFDLQENQAIISYLLDNKFRGQGLGSWVLTAGAISLKQQQPEIFKLIGHVQADNVASVLSFRKAGFTSTNQIPPAESKSLVFVKELK